MKIFSPERSLSRFRLGVDPVVAGALAFGATKLLSLVLGLAS